MNEKVNDVRSDGLNENYSPLINPATGRRARREFSCSIDRSKQSLPRLRELRRRFARINYSLVALVGS